MSMSPFHNVSLEELEGLLRGVASQQVLAKIEKNYRRDVFPEDEISFSIKDIDLEEIYIAYWKRKLNRCSEISIVDFEELYFSTFGSSSHILADEVLLKGMLTQKQLLKLLGRETNTKYLNELLEYNIELEKHSDQLNELIYSNSLPLKLDWHEVEGLLLVLMNQLSDPCQILGVLENMSDDAQDQFVELISTEKLLTNRQEVFFTQAIQAWRRHRDIQ